MAALVQRIRARAASLPTFDIPFLLILLLLLSYGLIMLFSAGYAVALYRRGDAYTYIRPQLLFAALGVLAMYAASLVDYHVWHRLAWPMLGISLLLLAIVLFMPEYNGCKRWIVLPGARAMGDAELFIKQRHVRNCYKADPAYGTGVAQALGIDLEEALKE